MFGVERSLTQQTDDLCFECIGLSNHPPGSVAEGLKLVAAGLSGVRGLREGLVEEGSRGTVGKPGGERHTNNALNKNM